mmetsp:Transcript_9105/g.19637  ORF Transcript_9105/g.19637 Transcript_9105/m.19637 type:complete len:540 (+) Transcript_9105:30-1649(+)
MFRTWGKKKATQTKGPSFSSPKGGSSRAQRAIKHISSIRPFDPKDDRAKVLVYTNSKSPGALLQALQKDAGQEKSTLELDKSVNMEIKASTLSLSNHHIVGYPPRRHWSRMRNFEADAWETFGRQEADAFVYYITVENSQDYLSGSKSVYDIGWEQDRDSLARLLRRAEVLKKPNKPLLLAVNTKGDDDFDGERLVNLLGLTGSSFQRPSRVVTFSETDSDADMGYLMENFDWLASFSKHSDDDEATAMTTEDDGSIMTSNTKATEASSPPETTAPTIESTGHYFLDYDPTLLGGNPTLQRFEPIKNGTFCPFAKAAKLWGGKSPIELEPGYGKGLDYRYERAAKLNAGPLMAFVDRLNTGENLDGFCLEIPSDFYRSTVDELGKAVKIVLTNLSQLDPSGENSMKMCPISDTKWRFRFAGEDFFLTTFSPAYKKESSRHSFGVNRLFILFQPLASFAHHGLTEDTPASDTNWNNPTSMRDKTRVAFHNNGCSYHIPETLPYAVAEHVVKPVQDDGKNVVRWWEAPTHDESNEEFFDAI